MMTRLPGPTKRPRSWRRLAWLAPFLLVLTLGLPALLLAEAIGDPVAPGSGADGFDNGFQRAGDGDRETQAPARPSLEPMTRSAARSYGPRAAPITDLRGRLLPGLLLGLLLAPAAYHLARQVYDAAPGSMAVSGLLIMAFVFEYLAFGLHQPLLRDPALGGLIGVLALCGLSLAAFAFLLRFLELGDHGGLLLRATQALAVLCAVPAILAAIAIDLGATAARILAGLTALFAFGAVAWRAYQGAERARGLVPGCTLVLLAAGMSLAQYWVSGISPLILHTMFVIGLVLIAFAVATIGAQSARRYLALPAPETFAAVALTGPPPDSALVQPMTSAIADQPVTLATSTNVAEGRMQGGPDTARAAEVAGAPSDRQLRLALAAAGSGLWDWDIAAGRIRVSPESEALMGLQPETFDGSEESWLERIWPADRDRFRSRMASQVEAGQGRFSLAFRLCQTDGTALPVILDGSCIESPSDGGSLAGAAATKRCIGLLHGPLRSRGPRDRPSTGEPAAKAVGANGAEKADAEATVALVGAQEVGHATTPSGWPKASAVTPAAGTAVGARSATDLEPSRGGEEAEASSAWPSTETPAQGAWLRPGTPPSTGADLGRAMEREEIELCFQPVMALADGRIAGFCGALQWAHHDRGALAAADLAERAEASGLLIPLTNYALGLASVQLYQWQTFFPLTRPLLLILPMSMRTVLRADFLSDLGEVLSAVTLAPSTLCIEIAYAEFCPHDGNPAPPPSVFDDIKDMGVGLCCGGLGASGQASEILRQYPFDLVTLDPSLIAACADDADAASRSAARSDMGAVVELAHTLRMDVIARGLRDEAQVRVLRELGCEYGQGAFYGAPVSSADAHVVIARHWSH